MTLSPNMKRRESKPWWLFHSDSLVLPCARYYRLLHSLPWRRAVPWSATVRDNHVCHVVPSDRAVWENTEYFKGRCNRNFRESPYSPRGFTGRIGRPHEEARDCDAFQYIGRDAVT